MFPKHFWLDFPNPPKRSTERGQHPLFRRPLPVEGSLARRHSRLAGIDGHSLPQRPGSPLEDRLGDVVTVSPVVQHDMQVHQRVGRHSLPEDLDELGVELADLFSRELELVDEQARPLRSSADVTSVSSIGSEKQP